MPLKESRLIQQIRRVAHGGTGGRGIGDDCAILRIPSGHEALVTTDFSLEGVHFRREWHPPDSVGHRCLTRGLSDIAAMGGVPRAAFLSLALPAACPQQWVDRFITGLLKLAARFAIPLAGGDTSLSLNGVLADIVVLGSIPAGQAILRNSARAGDFIYVTGTLGSAGADLNRLRDGEKLNPRSHPKHFYPVPRLAVGRFLRENKLASAMIDISDGLSADLGHICDESRTGAVVYVESLPAISGEDGLTFALHGGDEYELLFTAHRNRRIPGQIAGVRVTHIGEITRGRHMKLARADGTTQVLKPGGWEHFA